MTAKRSRRPGTIAVVLLAAPLALLLAPPLCPGVGSLPFAVPRINTSPSLPRGLYLLELEPLRRALRPGDLVLACPPPAAATLALALARGYLDPGSCSGGTKPLGKLVLAVAGDRLELAASGVTLNRCRLPATVSRSADTRGRPLPRFPPGAYRVRTGDIWLFSPHPRSFDSRYFGPVAATGIRGLLHPLLVGSSPPLHRWSALLRACAAQP
jgi:conjugative transfer signal peptidase TraF